MCDVQVQVTSGKEGDKFIGQWLKLQDAVNSLIDSTKVCMRVCVLCVVRVCSVYFSSLLVAARRTDVPKSEREVKGCSGGMVRT